MADSANKKQTKKRKAPPHAFKPGQSGNPSGRPKEPKEFKELAKSKSLAALKTVIEIMDDPEAKPVERIKAAEIVMDRAWGKPKQGVELTGEDGGPIEVRRYDQLSETELDAAINEKLASLGKVGLTDPA